MLRSLKISLVCLSLLLMSAHCRTALADMVTYELGPFVVEGKGNTYDQAEANAFSAMWAMVDEIESELPEGHVLLDVVVEDQGQMAKFEYFIKFHVVVWIPTPPGPPIGT